MGCNANTKDEMDVSITEQTIKNIKDNLEANLISQSSLNLELSNIYKKFDDKNNTPENIKALLLSLQNISFNNFYTFYITLYLKLQGLYDYTNIKSAIERDLSLKSIMKRNRQILSEVIDNLKSQKIINVSELSHDAFKKACERRGVKMNANQISGYYKLLNMKPKEYSAITENLRKEFVENKNMKNNIDKFGDEFKNLIDEVIKDGNSSENIDLEKFNNLAKQYEIKLESQEIEEIYNLFQNNFMEFICYIEYIIKIQNKENYDETLEIKATKLDTIARIESQPLPVVKKLSNFV